MAKKEWVPVETIWCDQAEEETQLMEYRIYPDEILPEMQPYRVVARRCRTDIECNMAGYSCKWAFTNPDVDRPKL
jgi:hypothetical protein